MATGGERLQVLLRGLASESVGDDVLVFEAFRVVPDRRRKPSPSGASLGQPGLATRSHSARAIAFSEAMTRRLAAHLEAADQALWGLQQLYDPATKTWEVAGPAPFGMARDVGPYSTSIRPR